MSEVLAREDALKILRRMLAYVRDEAARLRIMDVALLLECAEDAVAAFSPCVIADGGRSAAVHEGRRVEH